MTAFMGIFLSKDLGTGHPAFPKQCRDPLPEGRR